MSMQPQKLFSKSGNSISDRFQILKQTHVILAGRTRKAKPTRKLFKLPEPNSLSPTKEGAGFPEEVIRSRSEKKRRLPSSFFRSQSREDFYKSKVTHKQSRKFDVPPCGHYAVNYDSVKKRSPSPVFKERTRKILVPSSPSSTLAYSPDQQHRVTSPDFAKQLSRSQLKTAALDVNELRFQEFKPEPRISTKVLRVSTPDLRKSSARSFAMYRVLEHSPDYSPSYNFSQPDLGKGTVAFGKVKGRSPLLISHIRDLSYEAKYNIVQRRSPSPTLLLSRQPGSKAAEGLPSYMHQSSNRIGLTSVNDKALEMNSFYGAISPDRQSRPGTSGKSQSLGMIGPYLE